MEDEGDGSLPTWAESLSAPGLPGDSRTLSKLVPVLEDSEFVPSESFDNSAIGIVSLNLGGRNTNPVEFELRGDSSKVAAEAMAILRRAGKALRNPEDGPLFMPAIETKLINGILAEIYRKAEGEEVSTAERQVRKLLGCEIWTTVLSRIQKFNAHFFNALNLSTLRLHRPSPWEDPFSCRELSTTIEYLAAWKAWYCGLDRTSKFWLEDAPRTAAKRGMDVATAFAGLLIFDVMCLCAARCAITSGGDTDLPISDEDGRDVAFKELAGFASQLPASSLTARHEVAHSFAAGAHAVLVQEARSFAENPNIIKDFIPPISASDGFTAVFLRKDAFETATDISAAVTKQMEERLDTTAPEQWQKSWRTASHRLAAAHCKGGVQLGNCQMCLVSLHCSKSDSTGAFIEALREVLSDYDADLNAIGVDSNCAGEDASAFQARLSAAGFTLGTQLRQQQVTVAKQRTAFQTQVQKIGETDVSHKDYILSWTSSQVRRGPTKYVPDLRTPYGVEQETKRCVRLPTTQWPFDHCGVTTSFSKRFSSREKLRWSRSLCCSSCLVLSMLCMLAAPLAARDRRSPYGETGAWFYIGFYYEGRPGICEGSSPCSADWLEHEGSCYLATPRMGYPDLQRFCQAHQSSPAVITSQAENEFIIRHICPKKGSCYIGLHGSYDGRDYWWPSGDEPANYTRLVDSAESRIPLFPNSWSTDYKVAVVTNWPAEISGCRPSVPILEDNTTGIFEVFAAISMLASGLLLALPRPQNQRPTEWVLRTSFCVNAAWFLSRLGGSCFSADFATLVGLFATGSFIDLAGHAVTSLLSLWLIVKRMGALRPARVLNFIFAALVGLTVCLYAVLALFIDPLVPLGLTWPVVLYAILQVALIILYAVACASMSSDLYNVWRLLEVEATSGRNSQGGSIATSARTAKFHFFSVLLAVTTGTLRWVGQLAVLIAFMREGNVLWVVEVYSYISFLDSATNDVCVHLLAVTDMDAAVVYNKGITLEVAERASREVEQHRLAVRMLKAAPTSTEQLNQLAHLESKARAALDSEQERHSFLLLQSAVRVETARIHRLMRCVRLREMSMPLRYQYLIDVPLAGMAAPRQHMPAQFAGVAPSKGAAKEYLTWLYAEATAAQKVLFHRVKQLLVKFNSTPWPQDLGLVPEEFPWTIWAGGPRAAASKRLQKRDVLSPGDILMHYPAAGHGLLPRANRAAVPCFILEESPCASQVRIHRSGARSEEEVPREELRTCAGAAVFVPGPLKKEQRCLDKIDTDYEGTVPWPAAASLVDICRCMILLDDPYAVAALVAFLRKNMRVIRVKNRFGEDSLESHGPEELQAMFYAASDSSDNQTQAGGSTVESHDDKQYRNILINVEVNSPDGVPVVCEIQVTLSNLSLLKCADQRLYTIRRMKSPVELRKGYAFAEEGGVSSCQV